MNLKVTITEELENVRQEIDADSDQERAILEGWEDALNWVLKQLEGESK